MVILFFFNDTATTEIYTLSLHDALPIYREVKVYGVDFTCAPRRAKPITVACGRLHGAALAVDAVERLQTFAQFEALLTRPDRKSTRLNSSHANISYAVFCLKKKKLNIHR